MCILLTSTNHPEYPFILLSNRDEFFVRPTQRAHFRELSNGVKLLSPLDLGRPEHGTWIGVTTNGKLSVVLNYREENIGSIICEISRGIIPLHFLKSPVGDDEWYKELKQSYDDNQLQKIGGFTLFYGTLKLDPETKKIPPLNVLSNRSKTSKVLLSDDTGEKTPDGKITHKSTFGLSNSLFNEPWPKVIQGEILLEQAIEKSINQKASKEVLAKRCFDVLSNNTFDEDIALNGLVDHKLEELRNSIFIPPVALGSKILKGKYYGTRTQTIIFLDKNGMLDYYERDLHDSDDIKNSKVLEQHFSFQINS